MRPHNKNTPQVAVTLLRDRSKLLFAASRILSRDEPNPGGKITPRPECLRVRDSGGNSARSNDADPVDVLQSLARLIGAMLHNEPLLERAYHRMQRLQLRCQYDQARTGINGQTSILFVCNDCQQRLEPFAALRGRNPELSHMRPQRIDHLGLLPQQKIACSMLHQSALLLGRFRPHKSHPRPANCLADRLRVRRVVLVALDVSLHIPRRHQPNLVTEPRQLTCPVVRAGTGFDANEAGRQSFEELHHLTAAKLLPDDDPLGRVNAVNLENVLGDIQTDCGNLHVDGSLMWFVATITLRRFVAGSGRRPPHHKRSNAVQQKASYSITSSARSKNDSGIVTPSAWAVVRLMMRSNFVGCSTGISPGLVPRRILSTRSAARRNRSGLFTP